MTNVENITTGSLTADRITSGSLEVNISDRMTEMVRDTVGRVWSGRKQLRKAMIQEDPETLVIVVGHLRYAHLRMSLRRQDTSAISETYEHPGLGVLRMFGIRVIPGPLRDDEIRFRNEIEL